MHICEGIRYVTDYHNTCDPGVGVLGDSTPRGEPQLGGTVETGGRRKGSLVAGAIQRICSDPSFPFSTSILFSGELAR